LAFLREHGNELRKIWMCPKCDNITRKRRDDNTPASPAGLTGLRQHTHALEDTNMSLDESNVSCLGDTLPTDTVHKEMLKESGLKNTNENFDDKSCEMSNQNEITTTILTELRSFRSQITVKLEQQEQKFTSLIHKIETSIYELNDKYTILKNDIDNIKTITNQNNIETDNIRLLTTTNINDTNKKIAILQKELASLKEHTHKLDKRINDSASYSNVPKSNVAVENNMSSNNISVHSEHPKQLHKPSSASYSEGARRLVLYGLNEYDHESESTLIDRIVRVFYDIYNIDLSLQIEEVRRMGRRGPRRPVVMELLSKRTTKYIIENAIYFRNTGLFVSQFLDPESLRSRKILRQKMQEARRSGQRVTLRNNKLYINGREVTVPSLSNDVQRESQSISLNTQNVTCNDYNA
jgi:uncharacterized small protein (DUF1192 family)